MLSERISDCRRKMQLVHANKTRIAEKSNVIKTNNTFFDQLKNLIISLESYINAKECGFVAQNITNTQIKNALDYCKDCFSLKIIKNASHFKTNVQTLIQDLSIEWKEYIKKRNLPTIEKLSILRVVSINTKEITNIINCLKDFNEWPIDKNKYKNYIVNYEKANILLNDKHFDDEIEVFLRKITNREATILDLNDTILAWIKNEGLENNIYLSIKIN